MALVCRSSSSNPAPLPPAPPHTGSSPAIICSVPLWRNSDSTHRGLRHQPQWRKDFLPDTDSYSSLPPEWGLNFAPLSLSGQLSTTTGSSFDSSLLFNLKLGPRLCQSARTLILPAALTSTQSVMWWFWAEAACDAQTVASSPKLATEFHQSLVQTLDGSEKSHLSSIRLDLQDKLSIVKHKETFNLFPSYFLSQL